MKQRNVRLTDELDSIINVNDIVNVDYNTDCELTINITYKDGDNKKLYYGNRYEDMQYDTFKIATTMRNINIWDLLY